MKAYDEFNKLLKQFLKDLILVFPDDRDIKKVSSALNITMMDDPSGEIMQGYHKIVGPHGGLITNHDDAFFSQDLSHTADNKYQSTLFEKLHLYWRDLKEENRSIVWEYLDTLYALSHAQFASRG